MKSFQLASELWTKEVPWKYLQLVEHIHHILHRGEFYKYECLVLDIFKYLLIDYYQIWIHSSREYTLFGSPEPSSSSRALELFANRTSPEPQSMPLSPIGTGIGRPILGRHHINHHVSTQPSYDLLSPRRLFPPDPTPAPEFVWPQRPVLSRTSSWQTLVSEVPSVSAIRDVDS